MSEYARMGLSMKTNRLHNLTTQQIGWFLIVALVPLLIMGSMALFLAKDALTQEILRDLAYVGDIRKHQINDFFAERRHHLLNIAQSGQLISQFHQRHQRGYRTETLLRNNPNLPTLIQQWGMKNLVMISPNGVIFADLLQPDAIGIQLQGEFYSGSVLSNSFEQALANETISQPHHGYFEPYEHFSTFISVPIRERNQIIGIIAAEIDMTRLNLILSPRTEPSPKNSSGLLLATRDESGISLLHLDWEVPEPSEACRTYRRDNLHTLPMVQALQGDQGAGWNIDTACEPILVTWQPLEGLNLGMTLFKTKDEALATVDQLRTILFQTGSVAVLFALILAFLVSLPLIRPLLQLTQLTRKIAHGEPLQAAQQLLPKRIRINEIRELSDSIGKMLTTIDSHTQDLEEYQENLEHHVYYRTAALKKSQQEAEEANRSKSDFLARMSHEIRTPLNGIVGLSELLSETALNPQQQQFVESLSVSSRHLSELLNNILDFSKIEANKFTLHEFPFSLNEIIKQISIIVQMDAESKGLQFSSMVQSTIPDRLQGDAKVFRQVLLNLLSNAIKYTDQGKIALVITLEIDGETEITIRIRVSDTGQGIPAESQGSLFTPFNRLHSETVDSPSGTGLGLSITQSLVEQSGGEIWFQSNAQQGSDFFILLPLRIATEESTPIVTPPVPTSKQQQMTILLADDSKINRLVIESYLKDPAYHLITVEDGVEAVEAYRHEPIDLILMDIRMPRLNGIEATQQIRQYEQENSLPAAPIIAMTADVLDETRKRAFEAGCTHWLPKPTHKEQFFELLHQAVPSPAKTSHKEPAAVDQLTTMFMEDSLSKLEAMEQEFRQQNWEALAEAAHAVKGNALILGFEGIGTLMTTLQQHAEQSDADPIPTLLKQFRSEIEELET